MTTACAIATTIGGSSALLRLSGPEAIQIALNCDLHLPPAWSWITSHIETQQGPIPCRVIYYPHSKSFTGEETIEIEVPGSDAVSNLVQDAFIAGGASLAEPGAFTKQALANGRLDLGQALAILSLSRAATADAAHRALADLRSGLSTELEPIRLRLLRWRALVEAGLDFIEEEDVRAFDPDQLRADCQAISTVLGRWQRADDDLGREPVVVIVGRPNAGKSALFHALTGADVLISPQAGTTRDWLEAPIINMPARCIDTAGWLDGHDHLGAIDQHADQAGRARIDGAAVIIACSAPDAPLPDPLTQLGARDSDALIIATKNDLMETPDARAQLTVSAVTGAGIDVLRAECARRLDACGGGNQRQGRLLERARNRLDEVEDTFDEAILADHLRAAADALGDLIGETTPDDILAEIFSSFCIGK